MTKDQIKSAIAAADEALIIVKNTPTTIDTPIPVTAEEVHVYLDNVKASIAKLRDQITALSDPIHKEKLNDNGT